MLLGSVEIKKPAALAPLAGISDQPFRLICKEFGAGLVFSEMVSADGLVYGNQPTLDYLKFSETERPFGVQIFGSQPEIMAEAAEIISVRNSRPDFLDINLGCPVPKVIKRGAGSALLKDLKLTQQIVRAVKAHTDLSVLAKIRSGWDHSSVVAVELAQMLESCGMAGITVHPRTRAMRFGGQADWEMIRAVKQAVKIPIIGNGDIQSGEDTRRMFQQTGCDLVMVGRRAFGYPWIFREITHFLETGENLPPPDFQERLTLCLRHFRLTADIISENYAVFEMRKHISWYTRGMPDSTTFRQKLFTLKSAGLVEAAIMEYREKLND